MCVCVCEFGSESEWLNGIVVVTVVADAGVVASWRGLRVVSSAVVVHGQAGRLELRRCIATAFHATKAGHFAAHARLGYLAPLAAVRIGRAAARSTPLTTKQYLNH